MKSRKVAKNKGLIKTIVVFYLLLIVSTFVVIKVNYIKLEKNSIPNQENAIYLNK